MERRCSTFHEEFVTLQEKVEHANSLEEDWKTLLLEVATHYNALKTLEDEFVDLKEKLNNSLQQYTQSVYGVCDQIVEQARRFCPNVIISVETLNPFQASFEVTLEGDLGTSAHDAPTWFSFPSYTNLCISCKASQASCLGVTTSNIYKHMVTSIIWVSFSLGPYTLIHFITVVILYLWLFESYCNASAWYSTL